FGNAVAGQLVGLSLVGTGTLSGGGAVASDAAGLATFAALSINLVGTKQLTASSGTLPTGIGSTFTSGTAGAPSRACWVGTRKGVGGGAISRAVRVLVSDAFGNAVAGQLVGLSLVGTGTLSGGGAVASDAAGLATFAALSIDLAGTKQLTASSGTLPT